MDTLKAWSVSSNNNAGSAITVVKKLGLLSASAGPTDYYVSFMKTGVGPTVLGQRVREIYKTLF